MEQLEAGVEHKARMIQIREDRVHFYPHEPESEAITFRLLHDAFLQHRAATYHADGKEITVNTAAPHNWITLVVESWVKPGLADRIVIK